MTYTVGQVSDLLQSSGSTVRRWADVFASHLSPGANPGSGAVRQFVDDDLRVLAYISRRTAAGIPVAEIARELPTAQLPNLADVTRSSVMVPDDTLVVGLAGVVASSQDTSRQIAAALDKLTDIADLRAEVEHLRRRVDELERKTHRHRPGFPYKPLNDTSE